MGTNDAYIAKLNPAGAALVWARYLVDGQNGEITFAGLQGSLAGVNQMNVSLPQNLAGCGEVEIALANKKE